MLEELIRRVETEAASDDPLDRLSVAVGVAREAEAEADSLVGHFVERARGVGASWASIGGALGVTKQAAQQRWPKAQPLPGLERFTDRARKAVATATEHAKRLQHAWLGTEHLLLGLYADPEALSSKVLLALGAEQAAVEQRIVELVPPGTETLTDPPPYTPRAARVLAATIEAALALGHNYVGTEHLLLALFDQPDGIAVQVLRERGITAVAVKQEVISLLSGYVKQ